jgi:arylsulfatase A-like enzyme
LFFLRPGYTTWDGTLQSLRYDEATPERMAAPVVVASEEVVGHHTPYLPTATLGRFANSALTLFAGPGVREGQRRAVPMRLVDLAPTVAHLMGLPPLSDATGGVVADVLDRG